MSIISRKHGRWAVAAGAALALLSLGCASAQRGADRTAAESAAGEVFSPDEAALDKEIAELSAAILRKQAAANKGLVTRDVHAKQHGCVRAMFTIDKDIPQDYRAGVFADPGKEYSAWIRFSNGSPKIQDDKKGDARGMGVKLMGVEGERLLEGEKDAKTQDFVLISHDAFFVKDGKDYAEFFRRVEKGSNPAWFFFGRLPWRWKEFSAARRLVKRGKKIVNPLFASYFSATPYLLGETTPVKFAAQPCAQNREEAQNHFPDSPDYLRLNMKRSLEAQAGKQACFRFMVQKRSDPRTMSVEDSRVPWDQGKSKFVPVASISIPAQEFSSEAQMRFCENLSFTPWHGLAAHRPLGNINRTRKLVYETISRFRHDANHQAMEEPAADEIP